MIKLKQLMEQEKPTALIAVGDTVSRNLEKNAINTHLSITDNKSHRRKLQPQRFHGKTLVKVHNPRGMITPQAVVAIREAIASPKPIHIFVEGEEDLLTLIAVLYAPKNALVLYGQPHEGLVAVRITPEKKAQAERILKEMKSAEEKC